MKQPERRFCYCDGCETMQSMVFHGAVADCPACKHLVVVRGVRDAEGD
jgi:hypothetical protein